MKQVINKLSECMTCPMMLYAMERKKMDYMDGECCQGVWVSP